MNIQNAKHAHDEPSAGRYNLPAAVWHREQRISPEKQISELADNRQMPITNSAFDLPEERSGPIRGDCFPFIFGFSEPAHESEGLGLAEDLGGRHERHFRFRQRREWSFLQTDK